MMRLLRYLFLILGLGTLIALPGEHVSSAPSTTVNLTMSNPYCYQSVVERGGCYINVRSITASGSDLGFDHLDISINGKVRARMQTFFETTAYFSENLLGQGLEVSCGGPNAGGDPAFGNLYTVTVQAYASGASVAFDSAPVYCPYYKGQPYLPLLLLIEQ
jgi:hypothetical protein